MSIADIISTGVKRLILRVTDWLAEVDTQNEERP